MLDIQAIHVFLTNSVIAKEQDAARLRTNIILGVVLGIVAFFALIFTCFLVFRLRRADRALDSEYGGRIKPKGQPRPSDDSYFSSKSRPMISGPQLSGDSLEKLTAAQARYGPSVDITPPDDDAPERPTRRPSPLFDQNTSMVPGLYNYPRPPPPPPSIPPDVAAAAPLPLTMDATRPLANRLSNLLTRDRSYQSTVSQTSGSGRWEMVGGRGGGPKEKASNSSLGSTNSGLSAAAGGSSRSSRISSRLGRTPSMIKRLLERTVSPAPSAPLPPIPVPPQPNAALVGQPIVRRPPADVPTSPGTESISTTPALRILSDYYAPSTYNLSIRESTAASVPPLPTQAPPLPRPFESKVQTMPAPAVNMTTRAGPSSPLRQRTVLSPRSPTPEAEGIAPPSPYPPVAPLAPPPAQPSPSRRRSKTRESAMRTRDSMVVRGRDPQRFSGSPSSSRPIPPTPKTTTSSITAVGTPIEPPLPPYAPPPLRPPRSPLRGVKRKDKPHPLKLAPPARLPGIDLRQSVSPAVLRAFASQLRSEGTP